MLKHTRKLKRRNILWNFLIQKKKSRSTYSEIIIIIIQILAHRNTHQMITRFALLLLTTIGTLCRAQFTQFGLIAQWGQMEFAFPTPEHRQLAIYQRKFIEGNAVPIDVDVDYSGEFKFLFFLHFHCILGLIN